MAAFSVFALLTAALVASAPVDNCSTRDVPAPYKGDTSGCGKSHNVVQNGFLDKHTITSAGLTRDYYVHHPNSYDANNQYPIIVAYHGTTETGWEMEADTKIDLSAPAYIVVYPDGAGPSNDQNWAGANYSHATVAQDLQFTTDMLADLRKNFCVDSSKIYATGISNGGGFVDLLACNSDVGGEFAAFAPIAGAFYTPSTDPGLTANCTPARAVTPMLNIHGGQDTVVPYNGGIGDGGPLPSIPEWLGWWATRDSCTTPPTVESLFNGAVEHTSYTCSGHAGVLQNYLLKNHKHDWPSTIPDFSAIDQGDTPAEVNASDLIKAFFEMYYRPAA